MFYAEIILFLSIVIGFLCRFTKIQKYNFNILIIVALICDICVLYTSDNTYDLFHYIFRYILIISYLALSYVYKGFEFYENVLFILSLIGGLVSISCDNLLTLFISLELNALPLYIAAYRNKNTQQPQYVMFGMTASAIEFFGISLIYYATGSFAMSDICHANFLHASNMRILGTSIFMIGFFVKFAFIPFHSWLLEISESKKNEPYFPVVIIISKICAFVALMRCIYFAFNYVDYRFLITSFSLISVLLSSLCALRTKDLRKLISYISIEHMSLMVGGLSCFSSISFLGIFLFIICEILSMVGIFCLMSNIRYNTVHEIRSIFDLRGFGKSEPALAFSLTCLLISLAGVPPFIGFWGKYYILLSLSDWQNYTLFIACIISILISGIYTANILKSIWTNSDKKFKFYNRAHFVHLLTIASVFLCLFNNKLRVLIDYASL